MTATQNETHSERTANFQQQQQQRQQRPSSFQVPTCNCQLFWSFAHQWQFVLHKYGLSNKISSRRWPKRPSSDQVEMRLCRCATATATATVTAAAAAPCADPKGVRGCWCGAVGYCGRDNRGKSFDLSLKGVGSCTINK